MESNGYFPDNIALSLRFFPAKTENCILYSGLNPLTLKLEIVQAELIVPRLKLSPSAPKTLAVPYEATKVITYVYPSEVNSFSRSLNLDQLPSKLAIVVLSEDQLAGKQGVNAFNFELNDVKTVKVRCNGQTYPDLNGIQVDKKNDDYIQAYHALFKELGVQQLPFNVILFEKNYCIFGVNLHSEKEKFGYCDVDIEFSSKPAKNLIVFILCFFDSKYAIGANGAFKCDVIRLIMYI